MVNSLVENVLDISLEKDVKIILKKTWSLWKYMFKKWEEKRLHRNNCRQIIEWVYCDQNE